MKSKFIVLYPLEFKMFPKYSYHTYCKISKIYTRTNYKYSPYTRKQRIWFFLSLLNKFRWSSPLCREQGSRRHRHCYLRIAICCVYLLIQDMKSMPKMPRFLGKTTVRIELFIHSKTKVSYSITFSFIFFETKSKLHVFLSNFYLNFIFILFHMFISWYKSRAKDRPCISHEINAKNTQFLGKTIMVRIGLSIHSKTIF